MAMPSEKQLAELAKVVRSVLAAVRTKVRNCTAIHLFYAGPSGGAITIGREINPRMNPCVHIYEYSQQAEPRYRLALTLTEDLSL